VITAARARAVPGLEGAPTRALLDVRRVREQFPILRQEIHGKPLVYLDNAASTQKPRAVIDAIRSFYESDYSNIHRGLHELSRRATDLYEHARRRVATFLGAESDREIVFTRGATEAINLLAQTFGRSRVGAGDEILISHMEHHANIVPWQLLAEQTGAHLRVAPITDDGEIDLGALVSMIGPRTRLVSVAHVSNALGTVNPIVEIAAAAHVRGVPVLVDGAQAVSRMPVDVRELGCDFYVFSGHKMYGPTGIGALWGRAELLEGLPPYQGGGDMIRSVTFEKTEFADFPQRFEAGTPNIAGAVGLAAAIDWVQEQDILRIEAHEDHLLARATSRLLEVPGLRIIGTAARRAGLVSFVIDDVHPHDMGTILDREGIAIRVGHHCAQPVMARYGVPATARISFAAYNTEDEIDALMAGIGEVLRIFRR
jgi:cysteine desulfurase / selenocysteine lyase